MIMIRIRALQVIHFLGANLDRLGFPRWSYDDVTVAIASEEKSISKKKKLKK